MSASATLDCPGCSKTLRAGETLWGKTIRCPNCSQTIKVPLAFPRASPAAPLPSRAPRPAGQVKPLSPPVQEDEFPLDDLPDFDVDDTESADDLEAGEILESRPAGRHSVPPRKPPEKQNEGGFFGTEKQVLSKGPIGGIILMVVAVVWFFGGLLAGYIFFYPPILFLIGLVGLVKALLRGS